MTAPEVHHHDLVVLGASAGGVEALRDVVSGLPAGLPAAVLVVLHMPAHADSALATILNRCGPLPVEPARHGAPLRPGRIQVAVPDQHLLVKDTHTLLSRAPKQNRARPAVDALFRSAARWHGSRTVGAILSGTLDDGAAGLAAIDAVGGACLVQDPADALFRAMPTAALTVVPQAITCPAANMGEEIRRLVTERLPDPVATPPDPDLITETEMAENVPRTASELPGHSVPISCPDCTGGMNLVQTGAAVHYTCHIGHIWSPQTLIAAQQDKIEQALWTAVSMLEEQANIHDALALRAATATGLGGLTQAHQHAAAREIRTAAGVIRKHFPEFMRQP